MTAGAVEDEELHEKLRGFGFDLDRAGLERLCEDALSAEEVAGPLLDGCDFRTDEERTEGEWISDRANGVQPRADREAA